MPSVAISLPVVPEVQPHIEQGALSQSKAVFPSTDPVWEPLSQRRGGCEAYMQHLYQAVALHLRYHVRLLRAAEEVSRLGSVSTIVYTVLSDGRLRRSNSEMRELQATVLESLGWSACPSDLAATVADLGRQGAELTLDYARNLLEKCETACVWSSPAKRLCDGSSDAMQVEMQMAQDEQPLQRSETITGQQPTEVLGSRLPQLLVWRVYHELVSWLLLPRVDEVTHVWAGLEQRGWDAERVDSLWLRMRGHSHPTARDLAAAWFQQTHRQKGSAKACSAHWQEAHHELRCIAAESCMKDFHVFVPQICVSHIWGFLHPTLQRRVACL